MKKTWLFALALGAAALTTACGDDSGNSSKKFIEKPEASYFLTCASPATCKLDLKPNQDGIVTVYMSSLDTNLEASSVSSASLTATQIGNAFTMMDGATTAAVVTDNMGFATIHIKAGSAAGAGSIMFTASAEYNVANPATFNITVTEEAVDPIVVPEVTNINYNVKMAYSGEHTYQMGEVLVMTGKTCSSIVPATASSETIGAITVTDSKYQNSKSFMSTALADTNFNFTFAEAGTINYAVFGRVMENGKWGAYGCVDSMNKDNTNVTISLIEVPEDKPVDPCEANPDAEGCKPVDPCEADPTLPECQTIEPIENTFDGTFTLVSSFNALSLLPHASKPESGAVKFTDMQAGDWIEFVLDFLSDPEKQLPLILVDQVLPLITGAEWIQTILEKIPVIGPMIAAAGTDQIGNLLKTFGVTTIIEDYLKQLTGNIKWWNDAKGGVQIANEFATNFTMYGNFNMVNEKLDENRMSSGNLHNYASMLYHNGTFEKCLIGKDSGFTDVDGKKICIVDISSLDSKSVTGSFDATFSEIADNSGTVDIARHNLTLAYGKLIYAALIQILPAITSPEGGVSLSSIGDLLMYYIGLGLVNLYNNTHEDKKIEGKFGCDAIGTAGASLISERLAGGDGELPGGAGILSLLLNPTTVAGACTMAKNALDNLVDSQLDKLSVSSDKITFEATDCKVQFSESTGKIAFFGQDMYKWGSTGNSDLRCDWKVAIQGTSDLSIDGKFYAFSNKE